MSALGVSISDIVKVSNILIKCCDAFSKDGSQAQYEDTIRSHKSMIEALKNKRDDLVSHNDQSSLPMEIENCNCMIASLEQQLSRLEREYGGAFIDKRGRFGRMLKGWAAVRWAFRDPDKVRNQAISNSMCIDASLLSSIRCVGIS